MILKLLIIDTSSVFDHLVRYVITERDLTVEEINKYTRIFQNLFDKRGLNNSGITAMEWLIDKLKRDGINAWKSNSVTIVAEFNALESNSKQE